MRRRGSGRGRGRGVTRRTCRVRMWMARESSTGEVSTSALCSARLKTVCWNLST